MVPWYRVGLRLKPSKKTNRPLSFKTLFLIHFCATAMMTGIIWIVQIVHYPLFEQVGEPGFQGYISDHGSKITWIVFPLMTIELITGLVMTFNYDLPFDSMWAYLGILLIAIIWLSTAFLQVPVHNSLVREGWNPVTIRKLVTGNWIRTVSWTLRLILLLGLTYSSVKLLSPQ